MAQYLCVLLYPPVTGVSGVRHWLVLEINVPISLNCVAELTLVYRQALGNVYPRVLFKTDGRLI
jgi:hypothetical protein